MQVHKHLKARELKWKRQLSRYEKRFKYARESKRISYTLRLAPPLKCVVFPGEGIHIFIYRFIEEIGNHTDASTIENNTSTDSSRLRWLIQISRYKDPHDQPEMTNMQQKVNIPPLAFLERHDHNNYPTPHPRSNANLGKEMSIAFFPFCPSPRVK